MGNAQAKAPAEGGKSIENVFSKELTKINTIVHNIINEKDLFKNSEYNFLSQDVCSKNYLLLESDLKKHLKIHVNNLGESMYLIPRETETKYKVNKSEVCQRITHHYMKILYIICLVKYVYNVEKYGEYSMSGIIFRNTQIVDDILTVNYCAVPQKDFSKDVKDPSKLDFAKLEGLTFLTEYFMTKQESAPFLNVMKCILGKKQKWFIKNKIIEYLNSTDASHEHIAMLENIYYRRFKEKLAYVKQKQSSQSDKPLTVLEVMPEKSAGQKPSLLMEVNAFNPVFSASYCAEAHKHIVQTNTSHGKIVLQLFNDMHANYAKNIQEIERVLEQIIVFNTTTKQYELRDLDRKTLDKIILRVKDVIKTYYIQCLMDYNILLDAAKNAPNIHLNK